MRRYRPLSRAGETATQFLSVTQIVEDHSARTSEPLLGKFLVWEERYFGCAAPSVWVPQQSRPSVGTLRRRPAGQALPSTAAFLLELVKLIVSLACAVARQPLHEVRPERAQSGLVRGGRREPISRQPPRADLPRDLPTNSWHRQEPATARSGVTGSPAHEFLQTDHSGKIRPNGSSWRAAIRLAGPI
jgi:hypothetical protein